MPGRPLWIIPSSSSDSSTDSVPGDDLPLPRAVHQKPNRFQPVLDRFEYITKNAAEIQSDLLHSIIRENASCEYLQQFAGIESLLPPVVVDGTGCHEEVSGKMICQDEDHGIQRFQKTVPLVTHADIMPFIQRIAEHGNDGCFPQGLLTAAPVEGLCLSSGTTDTKAKYLLYHHGLREGTLEVASIAAAFREG